MTNPWMQKSSAFIMKRMGLAELVDSARLMSAHVAGNVGNKILNRSRSNSMGGFSTKVGSMMNSFYGNTARGFYPKNRIGGNDRTMAAASRALLSGFFDKGPDRNLRIGAAAGLGIGMAGAGYMGMRRRRRY